MSTKPGLTIRPDASIVVAASVSPPAPGPSPTPRPAWTATSPGARAAPVPSMMVPPVILRSSIGASRGGCGRGRVRGRHHVIEVVELDHVVAQDAALLVLVEVRGVL